LIVLDSIKIANKYNKKHDKVMRDIRVIISREPDFKEEFIIAKFKHWQNGQTYNKFNITKKGFKRLEARYKYNSQSVKLEYGFSDWIDRFFTNVEVEKQKKFSKYRVDFYFPKHKLVVEYDEDQHKYQLDKDISRENYILKNFNNVNKFIRVKEGCEIEGVKEILNHIMENSFEEMNKLMA